jgi:LAO/AO transport system kinase
LRILSNAHGFAPPRPIRADVINRGMIRAKTVPVDIRRLSKNLRAGSRAALARAITLIESRRANHQATARQLVQALLPCAG